MECLFLLLLLLLLSPIPRTDFRAWVVRLRFSFFLLLLMLMLMSMLPSDLVVVVSLPRLGFLVPEDESGRSNCSQDM